MNEIPLSLFNVMSVCTLALMLFSLIYRENIVRIITSFITMVLAYVNSYLIINGNVVMIQSDGETYSYIPVINTTYNYFWLFIAILMGIFMELFIADQINLVLHSELDEEEGYFD